MNQGRYSRIEQIDWWDGQRVRQARALVVGAGALGNELIKNLLMVGWGTIVVADSDHVEESNLSRSVLFRAEDKGQPKAAVIARNAAQVNPDPEVVELVGDLRMTVSAGLLSRVDVVFGCLDNVAARLAIGQLAASAGCLFIDGGLTTWEGNVRLFLPPDGPCYCCTLTEADLQDLTLRRSCLAYAARSQAADGVPTTPMMASATGAMMAQQALRWIHLGRHDQGIPVGRELRLDLGYDRFWNTSIPRNEDCLLHGTAATLALAPALSREQSWSSALESVRAELGSQNVEFHLPLQILTHWSCLECGAASDAASDAARAQVGDAQVHCARCGHVAIPTLTNVISGGEPWAEISPQDTGLPPWTWVEAQGDGRERVVYELAGWPAQLATLARQRA